MRAPLVFWLRPHERGFEVVIGDPAARYRAWTRRFQPPPVPAPP